MIHLEQDEHFNYTDRNPIWECAKRIKDCRCFTHTFTYRIGATERNNSSLKVVFGKLSSEGRIQLFTADDQVLINIKSLFYVSAPPYYSPYILLFANTTRGEGGKRKEEEGAIPR